MLTACAGADLNVQDADGFTPAMLAVQRQHMPLLQTLLAKRVKLTHRTRTGTTVAHIAAEAGNVDILDALLKAGASLMPLDSMGNSPLMLACVGGHLDAAERLLKAGADMNTGASRSRHFAFTPMPSGHRDSRPAVNMLALNAAPYRI
jgi:ankyrin repeat protein